MNQESRQNIVEQLREMPTCATFPEEAVEWLASVVSEKTFPPGHDLITEGATDRDAYFLVEGEVEVVMGGRQMGTVGPGEVEGEIALLYRRPRGGTATTRGRVRTFVLAAQDFDTLAADSPAIAQAIADGIIERLEQRFNWQAPPWKPHTNGK